MIMRFTTNIMYRVTDHAIGRAMLKVCGVARCVAMKIVTSRVVLMAGSMKIVHVVSSVFRLPGTEELHGMNPHRSFKDRCACCGGVMSVGILDNEIRARCIVTPGSKDHACKYHRDNSCDSKWNECFVKNKMGFPRSLLSSREWWIAFKAWIVVSRLVEEGWCAVSDVPNDLREVASIVAAIMPARFHVSGPCEIVASIPGARVPSLISRSVTGRFFPYPPPAKETTRRFTERVSRIATPGKRLPLPATMKTSIMALS